MENPVNWAVVIPALNEAATLSVLLPQLSNIGAAEVIIVNDCSEDSTMAAAAQHDVTVISLLEGLGAWGATQAGLRYAAKKRYDYVITMDADGQHLPSEIPKLQRCAKKTGADVVIGSCRQRGSLPRRMAWKTFSLLSGVAIEDPTSGFRLYMRSTLPILTSGKATLLEYQDMGILLALVRSGLNIQESEVEMRSRSFGKSRIFSSWASVCYYMTCTLLLIASKRRFGI